MACWKPKKCVNSTDLIFFKEDLTKKIYYETSSNSESFNSVHSITDTITI
jgi:hypothetical protein